MNTPYTTQAIARQAQTQQAQTQVGQTTPPSQQGTHKPSLRHLSHRHQTHRHQKTPKKPRYSHKTQHIGKDSTPSQTNAQNAQKGANTGANTRGNGKSLGMGSNLRPNTPQATAKTLPTTRQRADLSRLPSPLEFYSKYGLTLKGGGLWRSALCPFHGDTHPSLSINTQHGGYCCHVCGAKGDRVGFYMARFGVDFVQACQELGLYD